jgi:hypothetical protein
MSRHQTLDAIERKKLCAAIDLPRLIARDEYVVIERGRSITTAFRPERTPSVSLTFKDGIWRWKDFGSGKGGDVLSYLRDIRELPFPEAVKELRELAGVHLPEYTPTPAKASSKASKPVHHPSMRPPSYAEMERLAKVRGVSVEAVEMMVLMGRLLFGQHYGHSAFFIGKGDYWQVKRLDGELWFGSSKCITASGTPPAWLSANTTANTTHVIAVEGLVGILEALEAYLRCGIPRSCGFVAAYNRTSKLTAAEARWLAGRKVLIISDNDEGGLEASEAWEQSILTFGGEVERVVPTSGKDLGDVIKASPDCLEPIRRFLHWTGPPSPK